jgi:hypothetical protein
VKFREWVRTHHNEALLAGGGIVVTLYLALRARKGGSSSSGGPLGALFGSSALNTADALAGTGWIVSPAPSASGWQIPTGIEHVGSGYYVPGASGAVEQDISGRSYDYISSSSQLQQLEAASTPIFYQPSPGVFQQITSTQGLAGGTPLFYGV